MTRPNGIKPLAFLSLFFLSVAATNFTQCLVDFRDSNATQGGTDYHGRPVTDPKDAVALTYNACNEWCGNGREPFDWSVFSQQFTAWLLPWLALLSQLPFGAEYRLDNLISGEFPPATHRWILQIFLLSCASRPHCWVSHPRSVLARPHSRQHSLGPWPFLDHQLPQWHERCQGSRLPPTGSTTTNDT